MFLFRIGRLCGTSRVLCLAVDQFRGGDVIHLVRVVLDVDLCGTLGQVLVCHLQLRLMLQILLHECD